MLIDKLEEDVLSLKEDKGKPNNNVHQEGEVKQEVEGFSDVLDLDCLQVVRLDFVLVFDVSEDGDRGVEEQRYSYPNDRHNDRSLIGRIPQRPLDRKEIKGKGECYKLRGY